jgi:hypothetical protein
MRTYRATTTRRAPMTDETTLHTPGDEGAAAPETTEAPSTSDDTAARIADLERQLAQANALNAELMDKAGADEFAPPAPKEPKLIGENWGSRTAAEAKAAGVTRTVLCSDGYYVPGA